MANKLVLVGKAASGKDHLRKRLMDKGLNYGISHTTRPPREGEVDGQDYFFVSEEGEFDFTILTILCKVRMFFETNISSVFKYEQTLVHRGFFEHV